MHETTKEVFEELESMTQENAVLAGSPQVAAMVLLIAELRQITEELRSHHYVS